MSIMNKNHVKVELSLITELSVLEFQINGGVITECKPQRKKASRKVSGKEKLVFKTQKPVNRPSNAWDVILSA